MPSCRGRLFKNLGNRPFFVIATLLASTLVTDSRRVLAVALALSIGLAYVFMLIHLLCFYSTLPKFLALRFTPPTGIAWFLPNDLISQIQILISFNTGFGPNNYGYYYRSGNMVPV